MQYKLKCQPFFYVEAVAPISWLYQTVDAQKEEVFFPDLLITHRRHGTVAPA